LISFTELNQLVKLPLFVKHFIEHKNKDAQLSLAGFIEMHYLNGDVKDADYDEDMKLPFKTPSTCFNLVVSCAPTTFTELTISSQDSDENFYCNYKENFLSSSCLSSIWQPPKFC